MQNWKPLVGVVAIFALGVITGALGAGAFVKHEADNVVAGGPDAVRASFVHRLGRELKLTDSQREQVTTIVAQSQSELATIRRDVQPRVNAALDSGADQIRPLLTAEQRKKFDAIVEKGFLRLKRFNP